MTATPLAVLFALPSPEYLRYYDATMALLVERGHRVSVAIGQQKEKKQARLDGLVSGGVQFAGFLPSRTGLWRVLASDVRGTMDFLRYLDPRFARAVALRDRLKRKALPWYLHGLDRIHTVEDATLRRTLRRLKAIEAAIPCQAGITDFLARQSADLLVVSPLVEAGSDQVDLIKSARRLGIPTAVGIASWDNLTNKGLLRVQPDAVMLWNEAQKQEAIDFHGMDPASIVVTGAQPFDRWFDRQPARSRQEFCQMVGLPVDRPIVLFTGSSVFISRGEAEVGFVYRWLKALRSSDSPTVRDASVLIRPHPYNADQWVNADVSAFGQTTVWPRGRHNPVDTQNRSDYFDSLFHSVAIVGINTSAMIEGAITGRPVLSIQAEEFAHTQEGTLHFHHLLPENGGFLRLAANLTEHVEQLSEVIDRPALVREQISRFVRTFVRPNGVTRPCVPILADALEAVAVTGRQAPAGPSVGKVFGRGALVPLAAVCWAADHAEPLGDYLREPRRFFAKLRKTAMKAPHRLRLAARHTWRGAYRGTRRVSVYGGRYVRGAARRVVRLGVTPLRAAWRTASRILATRAAGPPPGPPMLPPDKP